MHLTQDAAHVPHYGVYEIALSASPTDHTSFDTKFSLTFTRPDNSAVTTEGFYDNQNTYKARAYADQVGEWSWVSTSDLVELHHLSGTFTVVPSSLKGQLGIHPDDPRQFAYQNGDWFLHIGDTGYRYVTDTEPEWQAYIDQASRAGFTKIRAWFCRGRSDVQALFSPDRTSLNLPYWQEIDRRLIYALNHHPHIIFKLIPYGEDTLEILRYQKDPMARWIARYAQARFSALPNVIWCVSNDREIVGDDQELSGRKVHEKTIHQIAHDMQSREPWGTLLTNHQCRFKGYSFTDADWSDMVTLEDMDQVGGQLILDYRQKSSAPVVNDEDRYEHYRQPQHSRYFFRRLFWASLLSGGHATYGGLSTHEAYDAQLKGMQGYHDAARAGKLAGANDFIHIRAFFNDTGLTLVNFIPDDALVGQNPLHFKCAHSDTTYLAYLANPSGDVPETDDVMDSPPDITIALPPGSYAARWYKPTTGLWYGPSEISGESQTLTAPETGDWVLLLIRKP
jgi:hypothetical protein